MSICSKRAPISWSSMVTAPHDTSLKEVLILSRQPGVISFGGGLPAPESFPTEAMARAAGSAFRDTDALQYGSAQGERALLEALAERETARGNPTDPQELLVVTGSQQALDLVTRCLADPGDKVLVESPTYIGALNAIRMTQPRLVDLPRDDRGCCQKPSPPAWPRMPAHLPPRVCHIDSGENPRRHRDPGRLHP